MAKLQGHFLKYRDDAQVALDKHAELVKDNESVAEMTVAEWLDRLNLSKYLAMFTKNQAYLVNELHLHLHMHDKSRLNDDFKFKNKLDEQRVKLMISRASDDKADFQFVTAAQARRKIMKFVKNEAVCDRLVAAIPDDTMTGFQLTDILIENYSEQQLLAAIEDRVNRTRERIRRAQDPRVVADAEEDDLKEETAAEKTKRHGHPDYDVEQLFKEVGAEAALEKLNELKIVPKLFWTLDAGELEEKLEVKVFGAGKKLFLKRA